MVAMNFDPNADGLCHRDAKTIFGGRGGKIFQRDAAPLKLQQQSAFPKNLMILLSTQSPDFDGLLSRLQKLSHQIWIQVPYA
jgi:hypothetical protein